MNNLKGNPHYDGVVQSLDLTHLSSDDSGTQTIESLLLDNAHATLTHAYEQRTSNMLSALMLLAKSSDERAKLDEAIRARLGLTEGGAK